MLQWHHCIIQGNCMKHFPSAEPTSTKDPLTKGFQCLWKCLLLNSYLTNHSSPHPQTVMIQGQKLSQAAGVQPVLLLQTQRIILWISILHLLDCKPYGLCKRLQESILFLLSTINLLRKQQTARGLLFMHKQGKCIP